MNALGGFALAAGPVAERGGLVVVAALAVAVLLLAPGRLRAAAMVGTLGLALALLVGAFWQRSQLRPLRERPGVALVVLALGLVALLVAALVLQHRPGLVLGLTLVALPFRVPIQTGGDTVNLLVPLYAVLGVGALVELLRTARGQRDGNARRAWARPGRRALALALAAWVLAYALQAAYSGDFHKGLQFEAFFYAPFAVLFVQLEQAPWTDRMSRVAFGLIVALSVAFVLVAVVQVQTRNLFLNPRLEASNQLEAFFRPNSLFYDPNIYGRFLVLAMLAVSAVMLRVRRGRGLLGAIVVLAVLWVGLVSSLSQSSFTALLVGLSVLAALRWGLRRVALLAAGALALGLAVVALVPAQTTGFYAFNGHAFNGTTFGRYDLVKGGLELFGSRPLHGWGSGSFTHEYLRQGKARIVNGHPGTAASHAIPVTVLAEQGLIGFAVYAGLLVVALRVLWRGAARSTRRSVVVAAFAALIAHSCLYGAFLEDPTAWALLATGLAFAAPPAGSPRAAPVPPTSTRLQPVGASG